MRVSKPVSNDFVIIFAMCFQLYKVCMPRIKGLEIAKAFCLLGVMLSATSCLEQYSIVGNTSLPMLDGKTLYLKNRTLQGVKNIDSCEVIHGKFVFDGKVDSTCMAELYLDNVSVMPVVIENGKISVDINLLDQKVSGGSLNERLYRFIEMKSRLDSELGNTSLDAARLMMRGVMPFEAERLCRERADKLAQSCDSLVVDFIQSNYNNVLGPEVFSRICNQYRYPIITPQIKKIIDNAPKKFLNNPYVKEYICIARKNMAIINGRDFVEEHELQVEQNARALRVRK